MIFAHTAREAKKVGFNGIGADISGDEFIDFGVLLIKDADWLWQEADEEKLLNDIPHVIDDPTVCKGCEVWGIELLENGYCLDCDGYRKDE